MRTIFDRRISGAIAIGLAVLLSSSAWSEVITNSITDWSADGEQGANNWTYGYFNATLDGDPFEPDGYGYATDSFIPFDEEPDDWAYNGNTWDSTLGNVPWTFVGESNGHPNGDNNGDVQFAMRRWESDYEGTAYLTSNLAKENLNCGNGTSVHLYHNGAMVDTVTVEGTDGNFSNSTVQLTLAQGDLLDFGLSPLGTDGTFADGCDGSFFNLEVADTAPPLPPGPAKNTFFADSAVDFSLTGVQGEKNWTNGYYNRTLDDEDDGVYQTDDFIPFRNEGAGEPIEPEGNNWNGTQWDLDPDGGPWTEVGQTNTHPNGTNSEPNEEHWSVRRYVVPASAASEDAPDAPLNFSTPQPVAIKWETAKNNTNADGVTGKLFINGSEVDSLVIPGNDNVGVMRNYYADLQQGDIVELHLTPTGLTTDEDGADGSRNQLTLSGIIPENAVNPTSLVTDSITAFSGEQGEGGWSYGYYDQRVDVEEEDGDYDAGDFIEFLNDGSEEVEVDPGFWADGVNHWNGGAWDILAEAAAPWTSMNRQGGHPTSPATHGDPEVHWSVRRWTSDVEGEVRLSGHLFNLSANGDGTVGRIFVDGEEVWSAITDGEEVFYEVNVTLTEGSVVDFAIDADGGQNFDPADPLSLDLINDGSDSTWFRSIIEMVSGFNQGILGDFNGNGVLDAADIDTLSEEVANGTNAARFDLNGDGAVNGLDRTVWVEDLRNTYFGDSNLDGEFGTADLVAVFQAGEYEDALAGNSTWATGDWNGDKEFTTSDLVTAFQAGGFELGPRQATAAVPEPTSFVLLGMSLLFAFNIRRRR